MGRFFLDVPQVIIVRLVDDGMRNLIFAETSATIPCDKMFVEAGFIFSA